MDIRAQEAIKHLTDKHSAHDLVVLLGAPDPESAEIAAETVVTGDPSYAGPLAEAQLGLDVYHVLDEDVRSSIPEDAWEDQVGVMADVLDGKELAAIVREVRDRKPG